MYDDEVASHAQSMVRELVGEAQLSGGGVRNQLHLIKRTFKRLRKLSATLVKSYMYVLVLHV